MKNYMIVAVCDPYNARRHYYGEKVLKRDGATPTIWVIKEGMTEDEAKAELWRMALERESYNCNWHHEDAESIEDMAQQLAEDKDMTLDEARKVFIWFDGEGIYSSDSNDVVLRQGGDAFHDDVMTYKIEEE